MSAQLLPCNNDSSSAGPSDSPPIIPVNTIVTSPWPSLAEWFERQLSTGMDLEYLLRPALHHLCRYTLNVGMMKTVLYSQYVFSHQENVEIDAYPTSYEQCARLYIHVMKRNEGDSLLEAWKVSQNQHLVEYLKNNFQSYPRQLSPPRTPPVSAQNVPPRRIEFSRQNSANYIPLAVRRAEGWDAVTPLFSPDLWVESTESPKKLKAVPTRWLKFHAIALITIFLILVSGVGIVIHLWRANFKTALVAWGVTVAWSTIGPAISTTAMTPLSKTFTKTTASTMDPDFVYSPAYLLGQLSSTERSKCRWKMDGKLSQYDPNKVATVLINSPIFKRLNSNSPTAEIYLTIIHAKNGSDHGHSDWLQWRPEPEVSAKVSKLILMGQFSGAETQYFCQIFQNVQQFRVLPYR